MTLSRRSFLCGAAATGGVLALGPPWAARAAVPPGGTAAADATTLARTLRLGAAGAGGYRLLTSGPGDPHVVREELAGARSGRDARRRPVLAFVHLTDIHVIDAESPARVEYLDRYDDDPQTRTLFSSAYRPQETMTAHVSDAMVRAVRQVGSGPVTGAPLAFAIATGDNTDNQQYNEVRWHVDVLDGTRLRPASGDPSRHEGVADDDPSTYDVHYWHPEGTPDGGLVPLQDDDPRRIFGFPTVPGLLAAVARPFGPVGLGIPWLTAYGNHDGLVQGNFPRTFPLGPVATGGVKVFSPPVGFTPADARRLAGGDPAALAGVLNGPGRPVTPDPDRRIVSRREYVAEHFRTAGAPAGHGFTQENLDTGTAYYAFDAGPVRGVVLDSVNTNGNSNGSLDRAQLAWLEGELRAASRRVLTPGGTTEDAGGTDRLVVVFSHHTVDTMDNPLPAGGPEPGPRVLGDEVLALLLRFPNVVLWVNGHTHRNTVTPRARPAGSPVPGGLWEVNTASHVDFPQQCRLLEVVDNHDGTLSVFGTLLDHAAPPHAGYRTTSVLDLASLARELAANDWQARDSLDEARGDDGARNVELVVPAPFDLSAVPPAAPSPSPAPSPAPAGPQAGGGESAPVTGTSSGTGAVQAAATSPGRRLADTGATAPAAAAAAATAGLLAARWTARGAQGGPAA